MNTDNIRRLADVIEAEPHTDREAASGFTMMCFFHTCGTPACIAGWADTLSGADDWSGATRTDCVEERAAKWLGLAASQAYALFWGGTEIKDLKSVSPTHAASVLRHLADTGRVDWSVGAPV